MDAGTYDFLLHALDRLRKRMRMSLLDVAQGTGINRSTVWLIFSEHQKASDAQLEAIRKHLFAEWNALRNPAVPSGCEQPISQAAAVSE